MRVEREAHVNAPPERLYEVVMDPHRLADWVSIHESLEEAPDGGLRKGSKLTQKLRLAGRSFTVRWTVVENDPARRVVWEGRGPVGSKASVTYEFTADGDGTDFSYANEYDLPGGPLGRLAGGAVRRVTAKELDRSIGNLKQLVEQ